MSELLTVLGPFPLGKGLFSEGKEVPFLGDNPSILQHTDQRCMSDRVTEDGCSGRHVQHGHVRGWGVPREAWGYTRVVPRGGI